jgi:hypothetical protein
MERTKYVRVPYTFILRVLDSKLDEIENIRPKGIDVAHVALEHRKLVDEKLGEIEGFWKTNYTEIVKIFDAPLCEYLKREVLKHIYLRQASKPSPGWDVTDIVQLYIENRWDKEQYAELKKSVLFEENASDIFA